MPKTETMNWQKERLKAILAAAHGQKFTDVECLSEEGAKRLRFALYKYMAGNTRFRITLHGKVIRLIPLIDQIKEIRHS